MSKRETNGEIASGCAKVFATALVVGGGMVALRGLAIWVAWGWLAGWLGYPPMPFKVAVAFALVAYTTLGSLRRKAS